MQIKYSPDADALIISFREGKPVDSIDISKVVQMNELNVSLKAFIVGKLS